MALPLDFTYSEERAFREITFQWAIAWDKKEPAVLESIAAPEIIVDLRALVPGATVETMTGKALAERTFAAYHLGDPQLKTQHMLGMVAFKRITEFEATGDWQCRTLHTRNLDDGTANEWDSCGYMEFRMNPAQLPLHLQLTHLRDVLGTNKTLLEVLNRAATLNLPNWYLAAGALSQTIWNKASSLPADTGINDYDLVYFDDSDLSYEAEDVHIQAGKKLFGDLSADVEIRNQARVHLWYEKKHGVPCPAHESVEAGIDSWISTSAILGVRLEEDGSWSVYAPRGLSDFFNMVVKPNVAVGTREVYEKKTRRWKAIWPQLKIETWPVTLSGEAFE
ncbi:hypothetical protein AK830_g45 [Neonectria ditissima]|uniref:Scytalone dehydratase-like domain-containing protein n=1 Tax=Neonectria ditissima TaxID=78410 RepID=A0A0P7BY89_9HYPO|nr:hypothetical protein AK830_g45 [Neonectria ditissima]